MQWLPMGQKKTKLSGGEFLGAFKKGGGLGGKEEVTGGTSIFSA